MISEKVRTVSFAKQLPRDPNKYLVNMAEPYVSRFMSLIEVSTNDIHKQSLRKGSKDLHLTKCRAEIIPKVAHRSKTLGYVQVF